MKFKTRLKLAPVVTALCVTPMTTLPTLDTAAESDTRVAPMHARKFAAPLQAANTSGLPVLLRIETKAGHGAGKPVAKQIEEATDVWAFLFWQLGVKVREH
ncbi:MAG TPA: prolyl oligopeptidase family serine peptidase [Pyrinomonadaceae bacterium]|jgi:prolyl oligopeptidase|nr:prolyl oligopeptidase family serine peptidase [Pyrinomonadaceae bacterium]